MVPIFRPFSGPWNRPKPEQGKSGFDKNSQSERSSADSDRLPQGSGEDSPLVKAAIARAKDGDMEALQFLDVRYAADVLRFVNSLVKDHHEAEDITQNVFVKLISAIKKIRAEGSAVRRLDPASRPQRGPGPPARRRRCRSKMFRVQDDDHRQISHERGPAGLREALEQLPEEQRDVLVLRHIVGLHQSRLPMSSGKPKAPSTVSTIVVINLQSTLVELGASPVGRAPKSLSLSVTQVFDDALGETPVVSIRREIEHGVLRELVRGDSLPLLGLL